MNMSRQHNQRNLGRLGTASSYDKMSLPNLRMVNVSKATKESEKKQKESISPILIDSGQASHHMNSVEAFFPQSAAGVMNTKNEASEVNYLNESTDS